MIEHQRARYVEAVRMLKDLMRSNPELTVDRVDIEVGLAASTASSAALAALLIREGVISQEAYYGLLADLMANEYLLQLGHLMGDASR